MRRPLPAFSPTAGRMRAVDGPGSPEPGYLNLRSNEVDVWRAPLGEQPVQVVRFLEAMLSGDEIDRASRFHFERDRRLFAVGRGTLRVLLGGYLGRAPREIAFRYGANGKPLLAPEGAGSPPLHFNVTHSDGIALLAFTRIGDVGIDLERMRDLPDWQAIAEASLSPRQLERLWRRPANRRREEFFRAWTQQEALLKAAGTGLGGVPPRVEDFKVYSLRAEPGFAAALAVAGATGEISIRSSEYSAL